MTAILKPKVKSCLLGIGLVGLLSACGGGSSSNQVTFGSSEPIVGSWLFVFTASQCEELWTFNSDGEFTRSALDERASGNYEVTELANSDRSSLNLSFLADNGQPDCEGDTEITSGIINLFFETGNSQLRFYTSAGASEPFVTYDKQ